MTIPKSIPFTLSALLALSLGASFAHAGDMLSGEVTASQPASDGERAPTARPAAQPSEVPEAASSSAPAASPAKARKICQVGRGSQGGNASDQTKAEVKATVEKSRDIDYEKLLNDLKDASGKMLKEVGSENGLKNPSVLSKYVGSHVPFWPRDKSQEADHIVKMMSTTREMLSQSPLLGLSNLISKNDAEVKALIAENDDLSQKLAAAKSKSDTGVTDRVLGNTKEKISASIAANDKQIKQMQADASYIKGELKGLLRCGEFSELNLSDKEIDQMFSSVTSEQDLQAIAVFHNAKAVTETIAKRLQDPSHTSVDLARDYYGMYTLMMASSIEVQQAQIKKIKTAYQTRLAKLKVNAQTAVTDAQELKKADGADTAGLDNRIAQNGKVIAAVDLYQDFLSKKVDKMQAGLKPRTQKFREALNSFMTIDNAGRAIDTMKSGIAELDKAAALDLSVPELIGSMSDATISEELAKLTAQVKSSN